jgi:formylglycine-generating enzyme required for sulfatase activity
MIWTRLNGFELPSEAQWEYACRAGSAAALPSGPVVIAGERNAPAVGKIGWYSGNASASYRGALDVRFWTETETRVVFAGTQPVARKPANAFGLFDMIGNVGEWCRDAWEPTHADRPTDGGFRDGDRRTSQRLVRGGSWASPAADCRSASRAAKSPTLLSAEIGLRPIVILDADG